MHDYYWSAAFQVATSQSQHPNYGARTASTRWLCDRQGDEGERNLTCSVWVSMKVCSQSVQVQKLQRVIHYIFHLEHSIQLLLSEEEPGASSQSDFSQSSVMWRDVMMARPCTFLADTGRCLGRSQHRLLATTSIRWNARQCFQTRNHSLCPSSQLDSTCWLCPIR